MLTSRIFQRRVPEIFLPLSSKWETCNFSRLQNGLNDDFGQSNIKKSISSRTKNKTTTKKVNSITKSNIAQYKEHLKGTRNISYIVDEDAAKLMFKYIKEDLLPHDVILESHPGPGILTKLFVTQTGNNIFAYEPKHYFRKELVRTLQYSQERRLTISDLDLHKFYTYYIQAKKEPELDKLSPLIDPLPVDAGNCDSRVKIATVVTDKKFFYRLTLSYAFQCCFFKSLSPVNPVIYAYIPCRWLDVLSQHKKTYTNSMLSVPFHFYFTYDLLDKFPTKGFYPVFTKSSERVRKEDDDYLHLIRIKHNPKIKDLVPVAELDTFHFFLKRILRTKLQDTFIGTIEKFIPNSGPEFIKEGFRVFSHPKDFTQEQFLLAYKIFCSLPAYEECMFQYYKRQWAMQFGEKDEEVLALKCDEDSVLDLEENEVEADVDVAEEFHANTR